MSLQFRIERRAYLYMYYTYKLLCLCVSGICSETYPMFYVLHICI